MSAAEFPETEMPIGQGYQLEDVVEILERRKWWITAAALLGLTTQTNRARA